MAAGLSKSSKQDCIETYITECCLAILQAVGVRYVNASLLERWDLQVHHADVVLIQREHEYRMGRRRESIGEKGFVRVRRREERVGDKGLERGNRDWEDEPC